MRSPARKASAWVVPAWRRNRRSLGWLSISAQLEALMSVLGTVILVRVAGLEETGSVVVAIAFAALVFVLIDPRLEDSLQKFVPQISRSTQGAVFATVRRLVLLDVVLGMCGAALLSLLIMTTSLPRWLGVPSEFLLLAAVASGLATSQGTVGACYAVTGSLDSLAKLRCALFSGLAVASGAAAITLGPVGYLGALLVGQGVVTVVLVHRGLRQVSQRWPGRLSAIVPRGFLRFTLLSSASTSAAVGSESAVVTVAGALAGPPVAAGIKIALGPGRLLLAALSPLWAVLFPRLSVLAADGKPENIGHICRRVTVLVALCSLPVLLGAVVLLPDLLVLVYGSAAKVFTSAAVVGVLAYSVKAAVGWSKVMPLALGRPGLKLAVTAGEGVVLMALLLLLLPPTADDDASAAMAVLGAYAVAATAVAVVWLALLHRLTRLDVT